MQFHIPQHLEIEDKIFGPLTIKQAIYSAGGAGGAFLIYKILPSVFFSAPLIVALGVLVWALAFYPEEKLGKPFIEILESAVKYFFGEKLYTWKKTKKDATLGEEQEFISAKGPSVPMVSKGGLASKSFDLDVIKTGEKQEKL
mgnify:FL=1